MFRFTNVFSIRRFVVPGILSLVVISLALGIFQADAYANPKHRTMRPLETDWVFNNFFGACEDIQVDMPYDFTDPDDYTVGLRVDNLDRVVGIFEEDPWQTYPGGSDTHDDAYFENLLALMGALCVNELEFNQDEDRNQIKMQGQIIEEAAVYYDNDGAEVGKTIVTIDIKFKELPLTVYPTPSYWFAFFDSLDPRDFVTVAEDGSARAKLHIVSELDAPGQKLYAFDILDSERLRELEFSMAGHATLTGLGDLPAGQCAWVKAHQSYEAPLTEGGLIDLAAFEADPDAGWLAEETDVIPLKHAVPGLCGIRGQ